MTPPQQRATGNTRHKGEGEQSQIDVRDRVRRGREVVRGGRKSRQAKGVRTTKVNLLAE